MRHTEERQIRNNMKTRRCNSHSPGFLFSAVFIFLPMLLPVYACVLIPDPQADRPIHIWDSGALCAVSCFPDRQTGPPLLPMRRCNLSQVKICFSSIPDHLQFNFNSMAVNIDYFKGVADRTVFHPAGYMAQFPGAGVGAFGRIIYPSPC